MRAIFYFAATMVTLVCSGTALAQYDDCKLACARDRDTRNASCPSPYDTSQQERNRCLKDSLDQYSDCIKNCPAEPPPSSGGPSSMGHESGHSAAPGVREAAQTIRGGNTPRPAALPVHATGP